MGFLSFDDGQGGVTNRLLRSEEFDSAAWTKNTGTTITPNAVLAPDKTLTADAIVYDGSGAPGAFRVFQTIAAPASGVSFTASVWLRADAPIAATLGSPSKLMTGSFGYRRRMASSKATAHANTRSVSWWCALANSSA